MSVGYPYEYHPQNGVFSGAWHADWSVSNPRFIVCTMAPATTFSPATSGYSNDGGDTWNPFPSLPLDSTDAVATFGIGEIHVGSPANIVWIGSGSKGAYHSTDGGTSWAPLSVPGVANGSLNTQAYFVYRRCCAADKAVADIFYLFAVGNGFFTSIDGVPPGPTCATTRRGATGRTPATGPGTST